MPSTFLSSVGPLGIVVAVALAIGQVDRKRFRVRWLLVALAIALVHGLTWKDGGYHFDVGSFITPAISALLLVWFREKTGSVVMPILLHNWGNAVFVLV